jgi:hypothetical protein
MGFGLARQPSRSCLPVLARARPKGKGRPHAAHGRRVLATPAAGARLALGHEMSAAHALLTLRAAASKMRLAWEALLLVANFVLIHLCEMGRADRPSLPGHAARPAPAKCWGHLAEIFGRPTLRRQCMSATDLRGEAGTHATVEG